MSTVTLRHIGGHTFEMPGVTTAMYAAKRIADELGYDPDLPWRLAYWKNGRPEVIPDDRLVCELEEIMVGVGVADSDLGNRHAPPGH